MCLLSVLRDLWRSRSFDIGDTQWLACEQRTVNTVITTSITTKSIILFTVNRCCCCCCCWHLWCCVVLMTVGHALPHLVQVCHRTVNKGLDVVVASRPCSGRCMDLLSEHAEDLHALAWPSVWKSAVSVVWLWHWNLSACSSSSASVTETTSSPTAFPAWHRAFVASWI